MDGEYMHILDKDGACSCGEFQAPPEDANFGELAAEHFRRTHPPVEPGSSLSWQVMLVVVILAAIFVLLWAVTAL